jgi:hypothetical protein
MLLLVLFALLILTVLAIIITQALKPNTGRAWLIAIIGSGFALVCVLVLRLNLPTQIQIGTWQPFELWHGRLSLLLDYISWPYALALVTLCLAVILTNTTRTDVKTSAITWAGSIALTAVNLLAITAGDPVTLALAWALIDMIKLGYLLLLEHSRKQGTELIAAFGMRLASLLALLAATGTAWKYRPDFNLNSIPQEAAILFLLAAGLRMGVLPLNLTYMDAPELRRDSGLLMRLFPMASAFMLIARLPAGIGMMPGLAPSLLRILALLAAVYSSLMWLTRKTEYEARPFWTVALASFGVISALNGLPEASRAWGMALLLVGSLLFLFDPPVRRIRFLIVIGMGGLLGLPYTPLISGWDGILNQGLNWSAWVLIGVHALMLLGYLRFILERSSPITGLEKHVRISFPLGLVIILEAIYIIGFVGWPGSFVLGTPLPGLVSLGIASLGIFAFLRLGLQFPFTELQKQLPAYRLLRMLFEQVTQILSLRWLQKLGLYILNLLAKAGNMMTRIIEGPGGILWSLVFIVLLMTLFLSQVSLP